MISAEEWDTRRDAMAVDLIEQSDMGHEDDGVQLAAMFLADRECTEQFGDRPQDTNDAEEATR